MIQVSCFLKRNWYLCSTLRFLMFHCVLRFLFACKSPETWRTEARMSCGVVRYPEMSF